MTQVHFTLKSEEIQDIIEHSIKDGVSRNILTAVFNQLTENQRAEYAQAKGHEQTENQQSQRNDYYERSFTTRVGTLELKVPRTRDGHFSPTVLERYQQNEKALMASMLEMHVSGVPAHKISKIIEELCSRPVSGSFISSLIEQPEPMANEWQNRLLSGKNYPYSMTDVFYIKVREENRVLSKSRHMAIGITKDGDHEIIGFVIQDGESEEAWTIFLGYLKERDLQGTELVTSDVRKGLVFAIRKPLTNVSWQRCQVHFLGSILTIIPKKDSESLKEAVKRIFKLTDISLAYEAKNRLIHDYIDQPKYSEVCTSLDDGLENTFQYTVQGNSRNRLRGTNLVKRLNQEVRRREKIVCILPN